MLIFTLPTRYLTLALAAAALTGISACNDSAAPEEEPEVETLRLTVGAQVVEVNIGTGSCTGCPLQLHNGAVVTAAFLNDEGDPDRIAVPGTFRLSVIVPTNAAGLAFQVNQASLFSGTFSATGTTSAPFNLVFELFHIEEDHDEFSRSVSVVVVDAP
jgi:hypothetical protein